MQRIVPHLWFDKEAKEAAEFYTSLLPDSKVNAVTTIHNTPSDDCDIVMFELMGCPFMAISAGPYFKPNPSISFMLNFDPSQDPEAKTRIDEVWNKLIEGGKALMPLDKYPFSERYGWVEDKYGFSWQLILTDPEGEERPRVIPSLMFTKEAYGKAEEASDHYISVFKDSKRGAIMRYPAESGPELEGKVMFTDFMLWGTWLAAMDGGEEHAFAFNEGVSLMIYCDTQEEMDEHTNALSAVPEAEQCGWIKDKYGVSWQVVYSGMDEMLATTDEAAKDRYTQAMLKMKRLDVAELKRAFRGE